MNAPAKADGLTRRDFVSDQSVRWCPGCGDYAILAQIQKTLPELGVPRENIVFLSGIGCSSRFPYNMNTYGIHSIHGRAPTLATGLNCARPELQIWVTTGDGDALAIGGNHLLHALRRNIDINIVLFNNRIYGLTKGQYSPTSEIGKRTKSSPDGSIENPVNPIGVAIGSEAGFIARTVDSFQEHMAGVLRRAARHTGAALIEVAQNCMIFNDGAWAHLTNPNTKADNVLFLEHGKPMRFGKAMEKGIHLNGLTPEVVNVADVDERALLVHDESATEPTLAYFLSRMGPPDFPTPVGIFRAVKKPVYDQQLMAQVQAAQESYPADLDALYRQSETWAVPAIALEGTKCPLCDHPNLPGADECELCLASLTQEEASAAEANSRIEQSLREDSVEKLNPAGAVSVPESATVTTALEVMRGKRIGCVLITNTEGNLIGIFTERDALTRVAGEDLDPADTVVREVMTRDPETVKLEHPLAHAVHLMVVGDLRYLPLVDKDGCPSGIIGSRDLINHIASLAMNWVTHG
jgi:2-oxoglutarate ferredoxin oxidoreductase subunit beta